MLRPPESVENKNDHDLPFNIAGLMQSLAERGAKWLRPTHRCVANHRYRALPRPGYGAGQYQEARGGPRRPVDGGMLPPGTRTVSELGKSCNFDLERTIERHMSECIT